jgi:hypothetical protein
MMGRSGLVFGSLILAAAVVPAGALAQAGTAAAVPKEPAVVAAPKDSNVTVYAGYRFSGGFTDETTGKTWELTEGPSFAVAADFGIDSKTQWELFVSHRNSSLRASGFSPGSPAPDKFSLGVTYYHLGGTYFADNIGKGVYVVGGLGVTHFEPGADLSSAFRFSLNIGVGYMIPLGQTLAVKLEGRGYVTLVNSSSAFLCSGGCVVQIKGDTLTQGEAMAGLVWRF